MPRATARRSARRWGSRFDVISGSQLTDSSSLTSDDAITTFAAGTTKTNGKASSESGFGDESSSAASQPTATTATAANQSALSDPYSASEGGAFVWGDEPHDIGVSWDADPLPSPRSRTSVNPNASDNSKSFPITYSSPPHHPPFSSDFKGPSLPPRRLQRWNHNASVFVASLPPEPNAELDKYLHESLGKHGNILNIKFIHDVRSGHASNCAFVQFEDPQEAVNAIQACHMTFIQGRAIRCEPAKAHRTLLISFCPPPSSTPPETFKNIDPRTGIDPTDKSPEWVRIRRPDPRTHFIYVTFNKVALEYLDNQPPHWTDESDPLSGPGALVSLTHEVPKAETMRILVELFGPLEVFRPFMIPRPEEVHGHPYAPHPFSAGDDASTYEVKWEQRQDAHSALYCLNRIPNLIVTWAHEHPHPANYRESLRYGTDGMSPDRFPPRRGPPGTRSNVTPSTLGRDEAVSQQPARAPVTGVESGDHERTPVNTVKNIASPVPYNKVVAMASPKSPIHRRSGEHNSTGHVRQTPAKEDFPPLPVATAAEREGNDDAAAGHALKGGRRDHASISASTLSLGVDPSDMSGTSMEGGDGDVNISTEVAPPLSRRESVTPPSTTGPLSDRLGDEHVHYSTAGAELPDGTPLSPETPGLIRHSPSRSATSVDITPSSSVMPITPSPLLRSSQPLAQQQSIEFANYKERVVAEQAATSQLQQSTNASADGAPVTNSLFVGGLDASYGWTEDKIKEIFGVYGDILGVKMIFKHLDPVGRCFIKFANPSDMTKAIAGENGRTRGGRSLRVNYSNNTYSRARIGHTGRRHGSGVPAQGLGLQGVTPHKVYDAPAEVEDVFSISHATPSVANVEDRSPAIASVGNEEPPSPPPRPKSPSAAPPRSGAALTASDSAPAALGLMRQANPKPNVQQSPTPAPDSKIARNETAIPSTPQQGSTPPNPGGVRSIQTQTPASSNTGSGQRRRTHVRAHSDPATPSGVEHPAPNADPSSQVAESQPIYPHPQDMHFPYAPIFYVHPQGQPPTGAIAFPDFANRPHWRPAWYPPFPANPGYLSMPTNAASGLSGPQPPLQPAGFVHNENGSLLPVYGNEALDQYINSRGTPAGEIASPATPGNANPTWPVLPPFPAYPPWLPQQLMVSSPAQLPPGAVLQPLAVPPGGADWIASSPSTPHLQPHSQPFSPSVQLSQFPHHTQHPLAPTPFPMQPVGVNHQSSSTGHSRSRPHGGKRMASHGEGIQIGTQIGKHKHGNESRSRQQHQQHYADEGSAHHHHHHQQHARQPNTGGHSGAAGQPAPIFPYAAYPFSFDPNTNPGSAAHPFPIQNSHVPSKATMQVPAQWNMVPAAYDNP